MHKSYWPLNRVPKIDATNSFSFWQNHHSLSSIGMSDKVTLFSFIYHSVAAAVLIHGNSINKRFLPFLDRCNNCREMEKILQRSLWVTSVKSTKSHIVRTRRDI